jgi:thymidylate synthase
MADKDGNVNSNYGWQWHRNHQLDLVISMLKDNPETRQAAISIYDGKEINDYTNDTPCTYAVQFTVLNGKLNMSVVMRSNDLWYGFCNDQYQFSCLQMYVAYELNLPVGTYYITCICIMTNYQILTLEFFTNEICTIPHPR